MTCAAGFRICPTCQEVMPLVPPCPTCIGREAGAQARDFGPCWAAGDDHHLIGEDEMAAMAAEGVGL